MMRQTGGFAPGATSTRSRSNPRAIRNASGTGLIPSWSPVGPIKRISRERIRSLMRCCSPRVSFRGAMRLLSCANGPPHVSYVMALNAKCHGAAKTPTRGPRTRQVPCSSDFEQMAGYSRDLNARLMFRRTCGRGQVGVSPTSPQLLMDRVSA